MDLGNSGVIANFLYEDIGCPVACLLKFVSGIHIFWGYGLILLFDVFEIAWVKTKQNLSNSYVKISLIMFQSKSACFLRNLF